MRRREIQVCYLHLYWTLYGYRCVVAAQVYGTNRKGNKLKEKWDAKAVEILLEQ